MTPQKAKALISFKKTRSLMENIIKMMEADVYCINIMQQNLAAIGLLRSAHEMLMEGHLNTCFKSAFETNNARKQKDMTNEILKVTKLFNK